MNQPYDGLRVIDLTMGWAGPSLTQMLADHGADVVKVESTTRLDWWRTSRTLFVPWAEDAGLEDAWEKCPLYTVVNENKRGITLDLETEDGIAVLRRLVAEADVLVENFTPRVMRNFGLDRDSLASENPGLITLSMPAFGSVGPWSDLRATAFVTESAAGLTALSGTPDEPLLLSEALADPNAGVLGALAVALALRHRRRTGRGQHIELAQVEALVPLVAEQLLEHQLGRDVPRRGNRSAEVAPRAVLPTRGTDAWLALSVHTDAQWQAVCDALDLPEQHLDTTARLADQDRLEAALAQRTREHDASTLSARLQSAGVPAAPVNDAAAVLADPHLVHRGSFGTLTRAFSGDTPVPGPVQHLSATPALRHRPAPTLGQHTEEVLAELGLTPESIDALARAGVTGTIPSS